MFTKVILTFLLCLPLLNVYREAQGLYPLECKQRLNAVAQKRAREAWFIYQFTDKLSHYGFKSCTNRYGIRGENLAMDYDNDLEVMRGWIDSPSHNDNLLNDFTAYGYSWYNSSVAIVFY